MKTALIIIDIQNDYFEKGAMTLVGSVSASRNASLVLQRFRAKKLPVVHIQHIASRPGATFFLPGTNGAEIHNDVNPLADEKIIVKHYPNSFRGTELLEHLTLLKITDLVVCGMITHVCVDSTVRAAKDLGFDCSVIGDACATKDLEIGGEFVRAEDVQKSFLAALNYFYSNVITTQEWLAGRY
jgi:nicotinamidase-related amidase